MSSINMSDSSLSYTAKELNGYLVVRMADEGGEVNSSYTHKNYMGLRMVEESGRKLQNAWLNHDEPPFNKWEYLGAFDKESLQIISNWWLKLQQEK